MTPKPKVVPIYSGGLDSTVLLYLLMQKGVELHPLTVNYGQRHIREQASARDICDRLGLDLEVADLTGIRHLLAGSSLTSDDVAVPEGHYAAESMKATVVPNRNMIMLAVAAGYALSIGAQAVAYGAHSGDHAIYPDCRPVFGTAVDLALQLCDWNPVRLWRPFVDVDKTAIVRLGDDFGVPMHLSWSCYKGGEVHCGKCGTCVERKEAFALAGVTDLTEYEREVKLVVVPDLGAAEPVAEGRGIVTAEGSRAADNEEAPRLIDMEKLNRVERQLVAEGKLEPVKQ